MSKERERITDEEIVNLALAIDSHVDEIKIQDGDRVKVYDMHHSIGTLPTSKFSVFTRDGLCFEGVPVALDRHMLQIRQDDGLIMHVKRDQVGAAPTTAENFEYEIVNHAQLVSERKAKWFRRSFAFNQTFSQYVATVGEDGRFLAKSGRADRNLYSTEASEAAGRDYENRRES